MSITAVVEILSFAYSRFTEKVETGYDTFCWPVPPRRPPAS